MSDESNTFDPLSEKIPLTGRLLIEASAGTGKTYNLSGLFVRLIAEDVAGSAGDPSKIVVVTYTRAATKELRERITRRLRGARELLDEQSGKETSGDKFLNRFKEHFRDDPEALEHLRRAFKHIDELSVHTIHGFAQRLLQEFGPQANIDFTGEVVTDDRRITSELIYDYWRRLVSSAEEDPTSRTVLHLLRDQVDTPEKFMDEYSDLLSDTSVELKEYSREELESDVEKARQLFPEVKEYFTDNVKNELKNLFEKNKSEGFKLSGRTFKPEKWPDHEQTLVELKSISSFEQLLELSWKKLKNISSPGIEEKFNKGGTFDALPLSNATVNWMEQLGKLHESASFISDQKAAIIEGILADLREAYLDAIDERDEYSYDDLLYKASEMIQNQKPVREAIRRKYPLSLIDEFQDTDPLQWAMFDKLYEEDEVKEDKTLLCLIGDPKQSIYRFRGADVNAYLNARESIPEDRRFSLDVNWRSDQAFVGALNRLWRHPRSFYNEKIEYEEVSVPEQHRNRGPLIDEQPALTWIVDEAEEATLDTGQASERAAEITARHIKQTLRKERDKNQEGDRQLKYGDIAVLCGTNREAALMKRKLFEYGLNSVQLSRDNVYESDEARELQLILEAAAEPSNASRLRAAIGTQMLGAQDLLVRLGTSDEPDAKTQREWETWLNRSAEWHERWQGDGFTEMMRQILQQGRCIEHLLQYHDGERRVTNLRHLTDLLQQIARGRPGEIQYLVHEFRRRRQNAGDRRNAEEEELRLESDRDLINIVTVHRSKGLEYPVVYSPFLWNGINTSQLYRRKPYTYHDFQSDDPTQKRIDIDGNQYEKSEYLYFNEELEDRLRTTYVALTRGKHHNIIVHVPYAHNYGISSSNRNYAYAPIDYVLLGRERYERALHKKYGSYSAAEETQLISYDEIVQAIESLADDADEDEIALQRWSDEQAGEFQEVEDEVEDQSERLLEFKEFGDPGRLRQRWTIQSYSGLRRGVEASDSAVEVYDVQMDEEGRIEGQGDGVAAADEETTMHTFPAGARTGLCWHRMYEEIRFDDRATWEPEVRRQLTAHGFDAERWTDVLTRNVRTTLRKPLKPAGGVQLAELQSTEIRKEMEFYFGYRRGDVAEIMDIIRPGEEPPGEQPLLEGLMNGFIDLTFSCDGKIYMLDYKSNRLGESADDYRQDALADSIREHYYDLQYHLYTLALHRYLKQRVGESYSYETHYGGVFYLYLRGIGEESSNGVFFDRPNDKKIKKLDRYFSGG